MIACAGWSWLVAGLAFALPIALACSPMAAISIYSIYARNKAEQAFYDRFGEEAPR